MGTELLLFCILSANTEFFFFKVQHILPFRRLAGPSQNVPTPIPVQLKSVLQFTRAAVDLSTWLD